MKQKKKESKGKEIREKVWYIEGMHCASCEVLIEKKLLEQKDIVEAHVSLKDACVRVVGKEVSRLTPETLTRLFEGLGYSFHKEKRENISPPLEKRGSFLKIAFILSFALLIFLFLKNDAFLGTFVHVDKDSSFFAFMILGLVASVSSCAALVGGLLLSLTKAWNEGVMEGYSEKRYLPHAQFHIGRVSAYAGGGAFLGSLGNLIAWESISFFAILTLAIAGMMFFIGLQMLGVSWARRIRIALPQKCSSWITSKNTKAPFLIGMGTFLLPCGFTLIAQGVALTTGSPFGGMLVMLAFALGTLPVLLGISLSGVFFTSKARLREKFDLVVGTLLIVFALYTFNGQLNVLGLPSLNDFSSQEQEVRKVITPSQQKEEQTLLITAQKFEYLPTSSTTLQAGVPTTMIVDNRGIAGCGAYMMARGLFPGVVSLQLGKNEITFIPKKGTYKLTCSMGMVPPVIIRVK